MKALGALLLIFATTLALQTFDVSPAAAQTLDVESQQLADDQPACSELAPEPGPGAGLLILTTSPRWSGVQVTVDGQAYATDATGCLIVEVPQGDHVVEVPSIEEGEQWQMLDGVVRNLRSGWPPSIAVGTLPISLQLTVAPPICELLDPQPTPRALAAGPDDKTSRLVISVVPRTEGVPVLVDGYELFSDQEGCLIVELPDGVYEVAVPDVYEVDETTRFVFGRWDDSWDIERTVAVGPGDVDLDLGIKILNPVRFEFFDASLEPFDVSRVQSATIVNSFGVTYTLSEEALEADDAISFEEVWLPKNRLRRVSGGLQSDDNIYVLRDVFVDGLNVVQSGEVDYIPAVGGTCPELSDLQPQRCDLWRVRLLLFPFQVELRNFIFRQPVTADVAVYPLNAPVDAEPVLSSLTSDDGVVIWPQVPRGDYEIRITGGGLSTTTPTIVTGPKVEQITVMTRDVLWFVVPMGVLMLLTFALFIIKPRWRLGLAAIWPIVIGFVLSAPSLGAALNRPLSASVVATYTEAGEFTGIDARVRNGAAIPVDQTYCAPDFELRIPHSDGIWIATYESPDFHDVEMSRDCRLHRVAPGSTRQFFSSTLGQEWHIDGVLPDPGVYETFVKVFDIPAGAIDLDLRSGLAPFLTFAADVDVRTDEIPFTNPFED